MLAPCAGRLRQQLPRKRRQGRVLRVLLPFNRLCELSLPWALQQLRRTQLHARIPFIPWYVHRTRNKMFDGALTVAIISAKEGLLHQPRQPHLQTRVLALPWARYPGRRRLARLYDLQYLWMRQPAAPAPDIQHEEASKQSVWPGLQHGEA
jgi:hypothetical protein